MESAELTAVLEELEFSSDLPPDTVQKLASTAAMQTVAAGSYLFREGSENRQLYFVRSGLLALEMNVPGRGRVRILTLGPGEMAGWSALLDRGKMTASAIAVEPTEVIAAAADTLKELCEVNHDFGFHLMRQMAAALSKRLVATRLQLLDLFADSPPEIPASGPHA